MERVFIRVLGGWYFSPKKTLYKLVSESQIKSMREDESTNVKKDKEKLKGMDFILSSLI